ncbi:MAG: fibronectin type III domain-containing protein [Candidatus Brocadiaceae bacterium]|uniref:fibronectin type III domain-containing protein n=1 Tax=Candidatus Wunengus sp. YC61 TaxID=3367698 RepID=UPI0027177352|nr:fibronectin type III domain-containing protein [Candidatus Brocadiaceae bacterium]
MQSIAYCLIVVCGILGCSDLMFAQTPTVTPTLQAPTVITGKGGTYLDENTVALYGTVNPNGLLTTVWAEYGTNSSSYDNTSSTQSLNGTTTQRVRFDISGLSNRYGGESIYYRIAAQNSAGTSYGSEKEVVLKMPSFSSSTSITDDATNITSNSATLNGRCYAYSPSRWFEYDTISGEYFYEAEADSYPFTDGYYANLSGLSPATTYFYRMAGVDKDFVYYGETKSFTTLDASATPTPTPDLTPISTPAPCDEGIILETYKATDVTLDSATLNGLIGGEFSFRGSLGFEYGTSSGSYAYGTNGIGIEVVAGRKSVRVNGLFARTTYYYRIYKHRYEIIPGFTPCYSYGNEEVFTTCNAVSMTASPKRLILQRGQSGDVTVTVKGDNCIPEGKTVTATIGKAGSRRISISSASEVTDANGQAKFTITAKNKIGNAKVTFNADSLKKTLIVKVK